MTVKIRVLLLAASAGALFASPAFHQEVLPILQKHCQDCHRPGEAAPFSLLTYQDARPWAKAIKQAVVTRKMPPWFADPKHGQFLNDASLSAAEIKTISDWVDAGAPVGEAAKAPPARQFAQGWRIGVPDLVLEARPFSIPASGEVEYQYLVLRLPFREDRWIQMAEARPGAREQVHHILVYVREPDSKWMREAQPGAWYLPQRAAGVKTTDVVPGDILAGYAPGTPPQIMPPGSAMLVKAGSDLVIQMHYTTNGKTAVDRTRIGLTFVKGPVENRVLTLAVRNTNFAIPAGAGDHKLAASMTLDENVAVVGWAPHMHVRGKAFEYQVVYPDGRRETTLRVPRYDFNWQLLYALRDPLLLPKGTRIECTGTFDNSANNPYNPDPKQVVRWGDQSWEEMMLGFVYVAVPAKADASRLARQSPVTE